MPAIAFAQQAIQPRITQAVDETRTMVLRGNVHPLARVQFDNGAAPASLPMRSMLLVLKRSDGQEAALRQLLDEQQDKSSPSYRKWLTPEDFGRRFGPVDQDMQSVTSWLQSHGLQIEQISKGRTVIEFSGTAAMVQEAFHTDIHQYVVNGESHWANANDPSIPSALAPVVAGVNTLHNFPRRAFSHTAGEVRRSKETGRFASAQPFFTLPVGSCGVQPSDCYAVGPYDFATIYNVAPLWSATPAIDGTGEIIAIVGETDINLQDVADFRKFFGLPASSVNVIHNGPAPGILQNGEEGEALLDVEWSGAVAKGATIDFVVTESTESSLGVDLSAQYIVDNNLAPVMSESYGECELGIGTSGNQFFNQLWQQAAAQGITVFLASGDSGSAVCDSQNAPPPAPAQNGLQVSGFSSTPYNVSVGGTDFYDWTTAANYWRVTNDATTHSSALSYVPETTWNNTCTNGVFGALLGFSTDPETNCNNSRIVNAGFVVTVGGSGGKSGCITSDGQHTSSCGGGYTKPAWQTALTPNDGKRDVPDLSLFAAVGSPSGSFYVVCEADSTLGGTSCNPNDSQTQFLAIGGTSASSPAMAGIMALVNQKNGARQGNANFVFYKLAAQQQSSSCNSTNGSGASCVFNDVTNGTIAMPCNSGSLNCTVSHNGDAYGVLSGYNTGAGYDLATGLGSVNAANLVNKWSSVTFTTSAITLNSVTPASLTHGQSATVTVTVAPKSGSGPVPTGAISLTRGPNSTDPGIESPSLTNGAASWSTTMLPGGTYSLSAHYDGDGTYGPSDSGPISVTVGKENSQTQAFLITFSPTTGAVVNADTTTATYGSPYLLRMNVANAAGVSCPAFRQLQSNCPSGTVNLTDNGSALDGGHFTLNSVGYAEDFQVQMTGGNHAIAAGYTGDASYNASSASPTMVITAAATTMSAVSVPLSLTVGASFAASVTVNTQSNGAAPTGAVTFFANGSPLTGTVTYAPTAGSLSAPACLTANVVATISTTGSYAITASYNGDANYTSATTSAVANATVKYPAPSIIITPTNQTVAAGTSVTLVAVVATSSGASAPAPTGTVPFFDATTNAPLTGNVTYAVVSNPSGPQLQANLTYTPSVTQTVTAQYAGDTNYPAAQSFGQAVVTVTGSDFGLAANPASLIVPAPGQSATSNLYVSGQSNYSGTLNFTAASCSGLPAESTCSFAPPSVSGTGFTQLTIQTTSSHALAKTSTEQARLIRGFSFFGGLGVAGLFVLGRPSRHRRRNLLLVIAAVLIAATFGCSGGGGGGGAPQIDPGTPVGSYTVTVTGTSGSTTHTATISLAVQ